MGHVLLFVQVMFCEKYSKNNFDKTYKLCGMIKGNEWDVGNIDFELQTSGANEFLCFILFLNFKELFISLQPGPYFMKVKIILSLKFKINLIFYLIKEFMKHSCLNFFYEIVNKISIKAKRN